MNSKYKNVNKFSNESLHSLLNHESCNSSSVSNFVCTPNLIFNNTSTELPNYSKKIYLNLDNSRT